MSKCLRCGAGNEWIEPVAKEAMTTKPKRKRPKVRYVARFVGFGPKGDYMVCHVDYGDTINSHVCDCDTLTSARRIASALNWHEASKRGELT